MNTSLFATDAANPSMIVGAFALIAVKLLVAFVALATTRQQADKKYQRALSYSGREPKPNIPSAQVCRLGTDI